METERPLSILPAIKCSDCGAEIQISAMGEHVCPKQQKEAEAEPALPTTSPKQTWPVKERKGSMAPSAVKSWKKPPIRPARTAPPRIDPTVANKPYQARKELLSPEGSVSSGRLSPITPSTNTASKPGRSPMMRSVTTPNPRLPREPSQVLSSNMDCAFPPFPTARSVSAARAKSPGPDSFFAPRSPVGTGGANVVRKMDTIAPGPFNAPSRSSSRTPPASGAAQSTPIINVEQAPCAPRPASPIVRPASPVERPASPALSQASSSSSVSTGTNREGRPIPKRPVRPEPLDGFLAMLKSESEASGQQLSHMTIRSNTFPLPPSLPKSPDLSIVRSPSAPPSRPRRPTISSASQSAPGKVPTVSTTPPELPPLPSAADLEKHSHPVVHASSDSASSTSSTHSFKSDLSPTVSASSSVSMLSSTLDGMAKELDTSLLVPSLQIKNKTDTSRLRPEDAFKPISLTTDRDQLPQSSEYRLDGPTERMDRAPTSPTLGEQIDFPESPVVPGFPTQRPQSPLSTTSTPMASPPSEHGFQHRSSAPPKRPGTSSKHICRGCNEPIQGKSVKAADGRLTGRYHKQCFVCRTCQSPFATADFYVIDNNPYCEHHYHELNNSLCAHCDRGIEGRYLETQNSQKFHPSCFTCLDCHTTLSDDYFEIAGKVYCEQHAISAVRRQEGLGPNKNMERRKTRFMVM